VVGNVAFAVHAAAEIGSRAFGMFLKSQHRLQSEPLGPEEVSLFRKALSVRKGTCLPAAHIGSAAVE